MFRFVQRENLFYLFHLEEAVSFGDALQLLSDGNKALLNEFLALLKSEANARNAFYFECVPTSRATLQTTPFAFTFVTADRLIRVKPNPKPFVEHLNDAATSDADVISFANLRGDAQLVVPKRFDSNISQSAYTHIAAFSANAPTEQQEHLWQLVGNQMLTVLNSDDNPRWLSTSGAGVYWLHVRIDSEPKYYQTKELTRFPFEQQ